jgi:hypothetical protein
VLRERGLVQYVREAEVVNWTAPLCRQTRPYKTANCEEWRTSPPFSRLRFRETPKNGASILPNSE